MNQNQNGARIFLESLGWSGTRISDFSAQEARLEEIRRTSNVAQALENVITQCADDPQFAYLVNHSREALERTSLRLRRQIHSQ